jgi:hypothetical protein
VHVRVADAAGEVFDVSLPGGLMGTSPCDDSDGWRVIASGSTTKWSYRNKSGGLPDGGGGCTAGAAGGLSAVTVVDKTASSKAAYQFKLVVKDATLTSVPSVPLSRLQLAFVLGAQASPGSASAQAIAGQCAEFVIEGSPVASSSPKPYCNVAPSTGAVATIKCNGA